ncbi:selenocysteine-specific translation elongation factor [candidate division KSB1 bacterium]
MKHTVIGTAGHIDHGKTLLLKALTGVDADRLPEEKERGMTIDLGFVFLGKDVTIIDVPGHEKFIKNMLAGVSTIDFVILVIAADDGIMPQTREHFEILRLLGIEHGIIALTKIDLVDAEWLELVKDDIAGLVSGTFLEDAPVLQVSSVTSEGVPEFKATLEKIIEETPSKSDKGIFRLWIDRVFVLKGIGTVIAGTVLSGILKQGDKLVLLPQGKEVRVRKLQVHNEEVPESIIGERVAVNLIGVEASEIERGNLLAVPGHFEPTFMVNAKLYLLKDCGRPLQNRTRVRFHVGTRELLARAVTLNRKSLEPGESTLVQFRLEERVPVEIGDSYIIRSYSPAYTIGGGTIIETHPAKLKYLPDEKFEQLEKLEQADTGQLLLHHLANHPLEHISTDMITAELSIKREDAAGLIEKLAADGTVTVVTVRPSKAIVLTEHITTAQTRLTGFLEQHHKQYPQLWGMKKSELKTRLFSGTVQQVFDAVVEPLIQQGTVLLREETVHLADHKVSFTPRQKAFRDKIDSIYRNARFVTPSVDELEAQFTDAKKNEIRKIVTGMIELGELVEIKTAEEKSAVFHAENIKEAETILVGMLKEKGQIRLFEFRERLDSTRKYTTPILIYFDRAGLTEFDGEFRRLKE